MIHNMSQNNLKIALRNLRRHKIFTALNIAGLAVGMLCCMLIVLFLRFEKSMDGFHANADRIYKLRISVKMNDGDLRIASAPPAMGPTMKAELAGIEQFTRVYTPGEVMVKAGDKFFFEDNVFLADSSFFRIFTFPLLQGDPETALRDPAGLVLSKRIAEKYFGKNDPMGQTLILQNSQPFLVTGVMQDAPENSTLAFDFILPWSAHPLWEHNPDDWTWASPMGFLLLDSQTDPKTIEAQLPGFMKKHVDAQLAARWSTYLQPLRDVYFDSGGWMGQFGKMGNRRYSAIFSFLALIVLCIACINFINLSTARAQERAREVGVRKTLGAVRGELIRQFLTEGMLTALLAFAVALALAHLLLPQANQLFGNELTIHFLQDKGLFLTWLGIALLAGFFAGSYPAFVLSGFRPVEALKSLSALKGAKGAWLRKGLVVTQFAASVLLIIGSLVIGAQLSFLQNKNLGFDKEQVVCLPLRTQEARARGRLLTEDFKNHPLVVGATAANDLFGYSGSSSTYKVEGVDGGYHVVEYAVAANWLETMNIPLLAGRSFRAESPADTAESVLVNVAAVRQFGWQTPENALGKKVYTDGDSLRVVGVTDAFHFNSLHEAIQPIIIHYQPADLSNVLIRVRPGNMATTVAALESRWEEILPEQPFEHLWLEAHLNTLYETEQKVKRLTTAGTGLAIFVACLGLFGLAVFTTRQRRKEIGIRKVLGATVTGIVGLLSKDFLKLVFIALVIASPLAWFFMKKWLADFAYHIDIPWTVFAVAGGMAVSAAFLTVSFQSVKAALDNPVNSLKNE